MMCIHKKYFGNLLTVSAVSLIPIETPVYGVIGNDYEKPTSPHARIHQQNTENNQAQNDGQIRPISTDTSITLPERYSALDDEYDQITNKFFLHHVNTDLDKDKLTDELIKRYVTYYHRLQYLKEAGSSKAAQQIPIVERWLGELPAFTQNDKEPTSSDQVSNTKSIIGGSWLSHRLRHHRELFR